jgi:predicted HD superfamily hydrolase involved in NAD metabolism
MLDNTDSTTTPYNLDLEDRVANWAKSKIAPNRIAHVEGVVETAGQLAERYAPEAVMAARLAGWIHDAAKHWSESELLAYARANDIRVSAAERETPMLLHGVVGYSLANAIFGFDDPALRDACAYHTTGAPGMGLLAKIVYLADMIEPGRDFPGVGDLRLEAERDLDVAVLHATDHTLRHLINKQKPADPRALLFRNQLLAKGVRY